MTNEPCAILMRMMMMMIRLLCPSGNLMMTIIMVMTKTTALAHKLTKKLVE